MQLKDYIFYRMYLAHKKHEGDGRISAIAYLSFIDVCLLSPLIILASIPFRNDDKMTIVGLIIFVPILAILLLNTKRYYKDEKIAQLKTKFKNSRYNHRVKNWMLYILPLLSGAWIIIGLMLTFKLLELAVYLIKG